jgi:hypothetical protein
MTRKCIFSKSFSVRIVKNISFLLSGPKITCLNEDLKVGISNEKSPNLLKVETVAGFTTLYFLLNLRMSPIS